MGGTMPALFLGHGNPMNAITRNPFRDAWRTLGARLPRPRAVLCISAHWETPETRICVADPPETIHDFYGFPPELFAQRYPAPGAPALAQRVQELLGPEGVGPSADWGLDHGAWCVLQSLFPDADVPVAQLSLGRTLSPARHLASARALAPLRDEGVLILGSGNVVHNLRMLSRGGSQWITPDWAQQFDAYVERALRADDSEALVQYERAGASAQPAVNSAEHYLPILYVQGVRAPADRCEFVVEGFDMGSISMRSILLTH